MHAAARAARPPGRGRRWRAGRKAAVAPVPVQLRYAARRARGRGEQQRRRGPAARPPAARGCGRAATARRPTGRSTGQVVVRDLPVRRDHQLGDRPGASSASRARRPRPAPLPAGRGPCRSGGRRGPAHVVGADRAAGGGTGDLGEIETGRPRPAAGPAARPPPGAPLRPRPGGRRPRPAGPRGARCRRARWPGRPRGRGPARQPGDARVARPPAPPLRRGRRRWRRGRHYRRGCGCRCRGRTTLDENLAPPGRTALSADTALRENITT